MKSEIIFKYKFEHSSSLESLAKIEDKMFFNTMFLSQPFYFNFETECNGLIQFIFQKNSTSNLGFYDINYKKETSLYNILFNGLKDLYNLDKFKESIVSITKNERLNLALLEIEIDSTNTIKVKIGKKRVEQKNDKLEYLVYGHKKNSKRINFIGNLFKSKWFNSSQLKRSLTYIFSDQGKGKIGPIVYVGANYRHGRFIVSVDAKVFGSQFKEYKNQAEKYGVKMIKIGRLRRGWQDFFLEDQIGYALSEPSSIYSDFAAVELEPIEQTIWVSEQPEALEIIDTFLKRDYSLVEMNEDVCLYKRPTEIHLINEQDSSYPRFRLSIHDEERNFKETKFAIEIASKIIEKFGYSKGSNDSPKGELDDEWYKYLPKIN